MTDPKTAARTVAARLKARAIAIKHVQALDLVAAGVGLANRHVLSTLTTLPKITRINTALLTSAATVLARHDLTRRQTIVDETSETLLPGSTKTHKQAKLTSVFLNQLDPNDLPEFTSTIEGIGGDYSLLRPSEGPNATPLSTGSASNGVVPFLNILASTMRSFSQGRTYRESMAILPQYDPEEILAFLQKTPSVIAMEDAEEGNLYWNAENGWGDFASASVFPDHNSTLPTAGLNAHQSSTVRWLEVEEAAFRDAVDRALREIDMDAVADDADVPGSLPLDYDAVAAWIADKRIFERPMGPLEIAVRDGAQRASLYLTSLSDDPSTPGGQVREWVQDVQAAFKDSVPTEGRMRELLMEGDAAISGIRTWIEASDRLWAWIEVASYPDAIDHQVDANMLSWEVDGEILVELSEADLASPSDFLDSERAKPLIDRLTRDAYFSAWESDRNGLSKETATEIADKVLELKRAAKTDEDRRLAPILAVGSVVTPNDPEYEWRSNGGYEEGSSLLDQLESSAEDQEFTLDAAYDRDEWMDALGSAYERHIADNDKSSAMDVVSSQDRVEMLFYLIAPTASLDDFCQMAGPWPDPAKVEINDNFRFGLAKLGWTVEQYRAASGDKMESQLTGKRPARAPEQLINAQQMIEIIENACTQFFHFAVYAEVPLVDVLRLDLRKPFALSQGAVATINSFSGTFQDVIVKHEIVFRDGVDGRLETTSSGYSPNETCGLYGPAYHAEIYDPEARRMGEQATVELDALLAVDALKRAQPGVRVYWTASKDGLTLTANVGVYDAARGYHQVDATARYASTKSGAPEVEYVRKERG